MKKITLTLPEFRDSKNTAFTIGDYVKVTMVHKSCGTTYFSTLFCKALFDWMNGLNFTILGLYKAEYVQVPDNVEEKVNQWTISSTLSNLSYSELPESWRWCTKDYQKIEVEKVDLATELPKITLSNLCVGAILHMVDVSKFYDYNSGRIEYADVKDIVDENAIKYIENIGKQLIKS